MCVSVGGGVPQSLVPDPFSSVWSQVLFGGVYQSLAPCPFGGGGAVRTVGCLSLRQDRDTTPPRGRIVRDDMLSAVRL